MASSDDPAATGDNPPAAEPLGSTETAPFVDAASQHPQHIGRYQVQRLLGRGGFGLVYLAYDEQLSRPVAIKVPHARLLPRPESAALYTAEARTVAGLDHPHIVPVFDVGSTAEFPVYIVCKYIDGTNLSQKVAECRLSFPEAAELVMIVAEALHYAHKQGLVHRDIKPDNILLDTAGRPYLADFGVALREEETNDRLRYAATAAYMSPEQARGEGHRVDGRSDIYSLGVVLYELITGRRPFRSENRIELIDQITTQDPKPPRQIDDTIPKELERICLKALAKRATERYSTAKDFADDLRHFRGGGLSDLAAAAASKRPRAPDPWLVSGQPLTTAGPETPAITIVPKGLRSFGAEDADFFLELLPGPRDREGLPESIRFWKARMEDLDPDRTFSVGLIYGPSGCGKSSLVKAGLLPRLSEDVAAVYVEATAAETEIRLLRSVRKRCPELGAELGLKDLLAAVRRGEGLPAGKKLVLVIDQFEQWLHARQGGEEDSELVQALRQCDGARVQCVVMVRDDFWMAATRFMRSLEIRLVEGENSNAVDLFPLRHAEKVLAVLGRAFGDLPDSPHMAAKEQRQFLTQAVQELAEDGKVICVRLALFAEMLKGRPWTPATLRQVGGTAGVGVTFLEETFSAASAPPEHRYHQKAARGVLKALLPESGSHIRGLMRSLDDLLEASGYAAGSRDFQDLIRLLDGELRLITPTDPEGSDLAERAAGHGKPGQQYYQLTHDYLVPALRDWLTRKQKETRRGRAELRLAERAGLWCTRPENRYLPALGEYLSIRLFTPRRQWTDGQRKMMDTAGRVHGLRSATVLTLLGMVALAGFLIAGRVTEQHNRDRAHGLVAAILAAETGQVPDLVAALEPYRRWADGDLRAVLAESRHSERSSGHSERSSGHSERSEESGPDAGQILRSAQDDANEAASRKRLHAALALLPADPEQVGYLRSRLSGATPAEVGVLREALSPYRAPLAGDLWRELQDPAKAPPPQRLPLAAALAGFDPQDQRWDAVPAAVSEALVSANPMMLRAWVDLLRPVRAKLVPALLAIYRDTGGQRSESERTLATTILEDYAADDPPILIAALLDADPRQFQTLFPRLAAHRAEAVALLEQEIQRKLAPAWKSDAAAPAGPKPGEALAARVRSAQGLLDERFAFCQTMPLAGLLEVAEGLRAAGYRPVRLRPYRLAGSVQAAMVWTRDGRPWKLATGLDADTMRQRDEALRAEGFLPVDAAGYLDGPADQPAESLREQYAVLWVRRESPGDDRRLELGVAGHEQHATDRAAQQAGFTCPCTLQAFLGPDGQPKYCGVKSNQEARPTFLLNQTTAEFEGLGEASGIFCDLDLSPAARPESTLDRYRRELAQAEAQLQDNPADISARLRRAAAHYYLGNDAQAVADYDFLIDKAPALGGYQSRAVLYARQGNAEKSRSDLAAFRKVAPSEADYVYLDAVVSAYLGDEVEGLKRLEAAVAGHPEEPGFLYNAACASALASSALAAKKPPAAQAAAQRAVQLLRAAVDHGYQDFFHIQTDPDLDSIRQQAGFREVLRAGRLDRRYAAIWLASAEYESAELHALGPDEHLRACQELIAQGYRPAAMSVAACGEGPSLLAASVWHRPLIADAARQALARRQANAALALVKLAQPEPVWALLGGAADPGLRSWIVQRFGSLEVDPALLQRRLEEEPDVSVRRALILGLGQYENLPAAQRQRLTSRFLDLYRQDPDPGIHSAAGWALRRWQQPAALRQIDESLAGQPAAGRWWITSQGQTMIRVPGPVEFWMGSPATEPERESNERLHRRSIGRSFALGASEVTVGQFRRFLQAAPSLQHSYSRRFAPEDDCPQISVTWFEAAAYCRWLSEKEDLPEEQMCYPPIPQIKEGLRLPANYLQRTGYRLPTEAEWEYACRAGSTTSRYNGGALELLGHCAWYSATSGDRTWPAAGLKPNDWGLADTLGNVWEWCQERSRPYAPAAGKAAVEDLEDAEPVRDADSRVLRGGSFSNPPRDVRAAARSGNLPSVRLSSIGFRLARTL